MNLTGHLKAREWSLLRELTVNILHKIPEKNAPLNERCWLSLLQTYVRSQLDEFEKHVNVLRKLSSHMETKQQLRLIQYYIKVELV